MPTLVERLSGPKPDTVRVPHTGNNHHVQLWRRIKLLEWKFIFGMNTSIELMPARERS